MSIVLCFLLLGKCRFTETGDFRNVLLPVYVFDREVNLLKAVDDVARETEASCGQKPDRTVKTALPLSAL
jgi:hypothetical protein